MTNKLVTVFYVTFYNYHNNKCRTLHGPIDIVFAESKLQKHVFRSDRDNSQDKPIKIVCNKMV